MLPPSHAEIRDLMVNAASASAGILVEGYDHPGDRIYTNLAADNSAGSLHNLFVNGFDNTLVQMDDFGHGRLTNPSSTSVLVVGGPLSVAGETTPGYTGLFMGSSCCNTSSYRVEGGGTLVVAGVWYEQGGPGWLNLDGAFGNFIGYENETAVPPGGPVASITGNNFTGNLTIVNSSMQNVHINLAGSTPANLLLLADSFYPAATNTLVQPSVVANTNTNPGTQVAAVYSNWLSGSISFNVPDIVSPGTSRNQLIEKSLTQLAAYKDPPIVDLPSENEDVRLVDVVVNNGLNSFQFAAVDSKSSASSYFSATSSRRVNPVINSSASPTRPWRK